MSHVYLDALPKGGSGWVAAAKLQGRQCKAGSFNEHQHPQLVARLAACEWAPEKREGVVVEQGHLSPEQQCLQTRHRNHFDRKILDINSGCCRNSAIATCDYRMTPPHEIVACDGSMQLLHVMAACSCPMYMFASQLLGPREVYQLASECLSRQLCSRGDNMAAPNG